MSIQIRPVTHRTIDFCFSFNFLITSAKTVLDDRQVMSTQAEMAERVIDAVGDATSQLIYDSVYTSSKQGAF